MFMPICSFLYILFYFSASFIHYFLDLFTRIFRLMHPWWKMGWKGNSGGSDDDGRN